jgi:hypothetical protein
MREIDHLLIVGAGFSHYAGLPLASDFTEKLLDLEGFQETGPNALIVDFLRKFIYDTFDHKPQAKAEFWPYLEDVFTCIDLSANTGHYLGPNYSPSDLRAVRRALIVRIIRMLRRAFTKAKTQRDKKWLTLKEFFANTQPDRCAFLSMNWDTVIDENMYARGVKQIDYGCNAYFINDDNKLERAESIGTPVKIIKVHGSANWLYCDSCRTVFWIEPSRTLRVADQLFRPGDWEIVSKHIGKKYDKASKWNAWKCPSCEAGALGTRIATFSYRKALDFPMYERSWLSAEQLLQKARTWTFIGYSLPPADYEFKHLLKRVQLSRRSRPELILIAGGSRDAAAATQQNYQKFFGPRLGRSFGACFDDGLNDEAMRHLEREGVLTRNKKATELGACPSNRKSLSPAKQNSHWGKLR